MKSGSSTLMRGNVSQKHNATFISIILSAPHYAVFSLGPARMRARTCTDPAHHYPCSRCLILWPSITTQASNETLLVSSSPDIRVLLQRLRYAIIQPLLHARISALQPWILNKHAYTEKISLKGGDKNYVDFSLSIVSVT